MVCKKWHAHHVWTIIKMQVHFFCGTNRSFGTLLYHFHKRNHRSGNSKMQMLINQLIYSRMHWNVKRASLSSVPREYRMLCMKHVIPRTTCSWWRSAHTFLPSSLRPCSAQRFAETRVTYINNSIIPYVWIGQNSKCTVQLRRARRRCFLCACHLVSAMSELWWP